MSMDIKIEGIDELTADFTTAVKLFPVTMQQELKKCARETMKDAKANTVFKGGQTDTPDGKKIMKKWGVRLVDKDTDEPTALVFNSAKHFHLFERGYNLTSHTGNVIRFIPGNFPLEKAKNKADTEAPAKMERAISDLLERHNL